MKKKWEKRGSYIHITAILRANLQKDKRFCFRPVWQWDVDSATMAGIYFFDWKTLRQKRIYIYTHKPTATVIKKKKNKPI